MEVTFNDELHEYRIDGVVVPSVTQLLQKMNIVHSFDDMDRKLYEEVVMPKAIRGTKIHDAISNYIIRGEIAENEEDIDYETIFKNLDTIIGSKFSRDDWYWFSEVLVNTDIYAGRADLILINDTTKEIVCVDFKTGGYTPLGVSWQTSLYLRGFCYLNPKYERYRRYNYVYDFDSLRPMEIIEDGEIDNLLFRFKNEFFDDEATELAEQFSEKLWQIQQEIDELKEQMKPLEERKAKFINLALSEFKRNAIKSVDKPNYIVTYTPQTTNLSFDVDGFRLEHEDLYQKYLTKENVRKSSLKVTVRKPKEQE